MKLPEFDLKAAKYDAYSRFYVAHGPGYDHVYHSSRPFIQFSTGELIVTSRTWKPDERRCYRDLGLTIMSTKDAKRPALYTPEGEKVLASHLDVAGQQVFLWDHETGHCVSLEGIHTLPIPVSLRRHAVAYFPGPGCEPIGRPMRASRPCVRTRAEMDHVKTMIDACRAWNDMREKPKDEKREHPWNAAKVQFWVDNLLTRTFKDLSPAERWSLICGAKVYDKRVETKYPYLMAKE